MTMQAPQIAPVNRSITVAVPIQRAWDVWTTGMSAWWPAENHIGSEPFEDAVLEARVGGRWFERAADGTECDWGVVRLWEPPIRLIVTWQIDGEWRFDPDPGHASEIEVLFTPEGDDATRIDLEHRGFENIAAGAEQIAAAVGSANGWNGVLASFAAVAEAR
jgi:uncharacterized protein YndB with AHSA1/START domain